MLLRKKAVAVLVTAGTVGALIGLAPVALAKANSINANCFRPIGTSYLDWGGTATYSSAHPSNTVAASLWYLSTQKKYNSYSAPSVLVSTTDSWSGVTGGKKWRVEASAWTGSDPWIGDICYIT
ncbi:hypothetical protein ACFQ08_24290 [Streptosporangium algeriense]|uniref:Uncharacterized protein n=1 Tax=Streptosporangium algeriense TaxID=1682748 RepID=A0ABW3DX37_9ACTN